MIVVVMMSEHIAYMTSTGLSHFVMRHLSLEVSLTKIKIHIVLLSVCTIL